MFDKKSLKSVFETIALRVNKLSVFNTPIGRYRFNDLSIVIKPCGKLFCVHAEGVLSWCSISLARSYPMSYKSAYRLVCSL